MAARRVPSAVPEGPEIRRAADEVVFGLARRRQLGAVLLDQTAVAGLGNYLRAEILFEAGVDPRRRAEDLDGGRLAGVAERVVALPRRSYRTAGVTLPDELSESFRAAGEPRTRRRFWVFGRAGEPCRRCGTEVERAAVGGRAAFFYPECQR